jgi:hypothetical protein
MFRKIPTTPRSADRSCNRIEFVPSLAATAALVIWLALAVTLILVSDLHWAARLAASSAVAGVVLTTGWSFILLRGPRAIRALDWLDHDPAAFLISLGSADRRVPAIPSGCCRYGPELWILRFETHEGVRQLLVDTRRQEPRALRRLARCHIWRDRAPEQGRSDRPAALS